MIDFSERPPCLTPPVPRLRSTTATVIPYLRKAWLVDDNDILELEVLAVIYDIDGEMAQYMARVVGSVGTLSEFAGGDVCFSEGDAIRIRLLRQKHAKRQDALLEAQRRQCDEAREFVESL